MTHSEKLLLFASGIVIGAGITALKIIDRMNEQKFEQERSKKRTEAFREELRRIGEANKAAEQRRFDTRFKHITKDL